MNEVRGRVRADRPREEVVVLAVGAGARVRGPELVHAPEGGTVFWRPVRRRRLACSLTAAWREPRPVGGRQRVRSPLRFRARAPHVDLKDGLTSRFDGERV